MVVLLSRCLEAHSGVPAGTSAAATAGEPLHLADDVSGDGRVEVDGVVPEALRRLVALAAPALEGFAHLDLRPVAVLGMILDPVHILQPSQGERDAQSRF